MITSRLMHSVQRIDHTCMRVTKTLGLITLCIVSLAFFIFPRVFHSITIYWCKKRKEKREDDWRKARENGPMREKQEKMFLYYTIRWVKTMPVAFFSRLFRVFLAFLCIS